MLYYLNQRTGAIYKENNESAKKTFSINWFFIGDDRRLYYHPTYSLIQKVLRCCDTAAQATAHFRHLNQKFVEVGRYEIAGVRPFVFEGQLPVTNRTCIQIKERDTSKVLKLLPIVDEDVDCMLHFLKGGIVQLSPNRSYSESPWRKHEEEEQPAPTGLIEQLPRLQRSLSLLGGRGQKSFLEPQRSFTSEVVIAEDQLEPKVIKLNDNQHYVGEVAEGLPHGGGKEVLLVDGLSFNGGFRKGKKHGRGYITNSSLDTLYCQFVEDQVCGI